MNLSAYVESVRAGVSSAAALADDHTRHVAELLGAAIDSATRLALLQALSDAAAAISADLAPGSVELRMSGGEPEFAVSAPQVEAQPTLLVPPDAAEPATSDGEPEDEPVARVSLRLPQSVKAQVERRASAEGISTNAWLIRAVLDALGDGRRGPGPQPPRPPAAFGFFGPNGPFGEQGVFGPHGPFGGGRPLPPEPPGDQPPARRNVQGWVR